MSNNAAGRTRPLSPHLMIYKPLPTMLASITHRASGVALYTGTLFLAWWLIAASLGEEAYGTVMWFFNSFIGWIILFGYTWALVVHMLGGIRHFVWDTGRALEKETATRLAYATFGGSIAITVLIWIVGFLAL